MKQFLSVALCVILLLPTVACGKSNNTSAGKNGDVQIRIARYSADKILQEKEYEDSTFLSEFFFAMRSKWIWIGTVNSYCIGMQDDEYISPLEPSPVILRFRKMCLRYIMNIIMRWSLSMMKNQT